jgi:hypothetical protein
LDKITIGYKGLVCLHPVTWPDQQMVALKAELVRAALAQQHSDHRLADMREYVNGYQAAFANLNSGQAATLFSSYDQQTVDIHFQWTRQTGCDTAALQRFNPNRNEGLRLVRHRP